LHVDPAAGGEIPDVAGSVAHSAGGQTISSRPVIQALFGSCVIEIFENDANPATDDISRDRRGAAVMTRMAAFVRDK
jgi:hypothetical protein